MRISRILRSVGFDSIPNFSLFVCDFDFDFEIWVWGFFLSEYKRRIDPERWNFWEVYILFHYSVLIPFAFQILDCTEWKEKNLHITVELRFWQFGISFWLSFWLSGCKMGLQQSKGQLLYEQVNYGNVEGIKTLKDQGAGLEVN